MKNAWIKSPKVTGSQVQINEKSNHSNLDKISSQRSERFPINSNENAQRSTAKPLAQLLSKHEVALNTKMLSPKWSSVSIVKSQAGVTAAVKNVIPPNFNASHFPPLVSESSEPSHPSFRSTSTTNTAWNQSHRCPIAMSDTNNVSTTLRVPTTTSNSTSCSTPSVPQPKLPMKMQSKRKMPQPKSSDQSAGVKPSLVRKTNVSIRYASSEKKPVSFKNVAQESDHKTSMTPLHTSHTAAKGSTTDSATTNHVSANQHQDNMLQIPLGFSTTLKGKQKLKRKKILSPLKKAILRERLQQYRASCGRMDNTHEEDHGTSKNSTQNEHISDGMYSTVVCLKDFVTFDDVLDDDNYQEILSDLKSLATKVGTFRQVFIPRSGDLVGFSFVQFESKSDTFAAHACWENLVLGGSPISTIIIPQNMFPTADLTHDLYLIDEFITKEMLLSCHSVASNDSHQRDESLVKENIDLRVAATRIVLLDNILSEEDFEDEESLNECKEDIQTLARKYGDVVSITIQMDSPTERRVAITFQNEFEANSAVSALHGMIVGGQTVHASLLPQSNDFQSKAKFILQNILTDDDFDDLDCLEETKADLMKLLSEFGDIESFDISLDGANKGNISVEYVSDSSVHQAYSKLQGTLFGGAPIQASLESYGGQTKEDSTAKVSPPLNVFDSMMTAGGKVIPPQYAEMKRVPKIPNKGVPRAYASGVYHEIAIPLINEMLGELMRLQLRAKEANNTKVKRRLVMGIREVIRGIRSHKVKMVVLANNLDEYGALEEKLQEILDLAKENEVPVISVLNKRKIGKAVGKSIKVSVVGIENPEGAFEAFKKLKKLCCV